MPGIGKKSAQRIAFHLLERGRDGAEELSKALGASVSGIGHCKRCRMFTEHELCNICSASGRDESLLCTVESPADVMAVEDATGFRGLYFVLMGHLSPLDGIGPDELGLDALENRLADDELKELIIATNPTVEGDATAHYLADMAARYKVPASLANDHRHLTRLAPRLRACAPETRLMRLDEMGSGLAWRPVKKPAAQQM